MALLQNIWKPKLLEKVDYRPEALGTGSFFMPAIVNTIDLAYKNVENP